MLSAVTRSAVIESIDLGSRFRLTPLTSALLELKEMNDD
jgi:hypothetical protein